MATTKVRAEVLNLNAGRADYSLTATNTVTYVGASGGNQYVFNGAYGTYGVVNGTYVLSSVSSAHPIAIINNGKTSLISYTGAVNEGTGTGPDGNTYTFYSGNVTITVSGDFDTVSYYCQNHGYMGGKDNLIYVSSVGESGLKMPSGTEVNRPTAAAGQIRNNTNETSAASSSCEEYYNGTEWKRINNVELPIVPSENFNAITYTGDGANPRSITGVGFKPDLLWIKKRNSADDNVWFDTTRGPQKELITNSNAAEATKAGDAIISFDSDGFTTGNNGAINANGDTYVAWCWKVNGGTQTTNTDGDITSDVQVNSKAGFSIVQFQTNGNSANRVGHGLSQTPDVVLYKQSSQVANWWWYTSLFDGSFDYVQFNSDGAIQNSSGAAPDSTTIFAESGSSGQTMNAYCFHSVDGYSKFGTYQGNASQDGPLVETGFEPAFVMVKRLSQTANWRVVDNTRSPFNHRQKILFPNLTNAEVDSTADAVDFLSTGFKISNDDTSWNANADKYLYIAFASDPSAAPTLADSFNTTAYTGNGTSNRQIPSLGFNPSLVWIKNRTVARDHMAFDNTRLLGSELVPGSYPNLDAAEFNTTANDFNSFDANGFTVGSDPYTNENGQEMVAWSWKANSIPSINNDGTIQSIVSVNQAAGFSIVTYTGDGSASSTVGHGLGVIPDLTIFKKSSGSDYWHVFDTAQNTVMFLNESTAASTISGGTNGAVDIANMTSTKFGFLQGSSSVNNQNASGATYFVYAFKSIAGFSKIGTYTGNGSATGPIVTTGFQPSWVMIKEASQANHWNIYDNKRTPTNPRDKQLQANLVDVETTNTSLEIDFLSTSFQPKGTGGGSNRNGSTYLYMAFKENPTQPTIPSGEMEYLVQAGGASGASNGGGGGAGGLRTTYGSSSGGGSSAETNITLSAGTYTITVGGGGASIDNSTSYQSIGNAGTATTISGNATVNTVGGGGGGSNNNPPATGGCGGGSGSGTGGPTGAAGTAGEGFAGGNGMSATHPYTGGGGGGTAAVGATASGSAPGAGGAGLIVAITGSNAGYGGGGGGTGGTGVGYTGPGGAGGFGGGGAGGAYNGSGTAGSANTGGGGGATGDAGTFTSGAGGSGVVILRMNTSDYSGTTTGSPTVTTVGSETILTYTGSGTYVHS